MKNKASNIIFIDAHRLLFLVALSKETQTDK
jgi:hypothetical protein